MESIRIKDKTFHVTEKDKAKAEALGLSDKSIRTRVRNGWTVEEAHSIPIGVRLKDYREAQSILHIQSKAEKTRKALREERHKQDHPWLYDGTPQQHERSSYVSKDMKHYAIAKLKTDMYGNSQLV